MRKRPPLHSTSGSSSGRKRASFSITISGSAPASSSARVSPPGPGPTSITGLPRNIACGARDAARDVQIEQEVLAEPFVRPELVRFEFFAQRGQVVGVHARARRCAISHAMRQRGAEAVGARFAFAGDVEAGAVIGRGADDGQAERDVHRVPEVQRLDRDQALIVIERDDRVVARARVFVKQRVGRARVGSPASLRRASARPRD